MSTTATTHTTLITAENEWKFNKYGKADIWFGNFAVNNYNERALYIPQEPEVSTLVGIKLKPEERVFKVDTDLIRPRGTFYFVKINIEKNLVYFNIADQDTEEVIFETKGKKMLYFNHKPF